MILVLIKFGHLSKSYIFLQYRSHCHIRAFSCNINQCLVLHLPFTNCYKTQTLHNSEVSPTWLKAEEAVFGLHKQIIVGATKPTVIGEAPGLCEAAPTIRFTQHERDILIWLGCRASNVEYLWVTRVGKLKTILLMHHNVNTILQSWLRRIVTTITNMIVIISFLPKYWISSVLSC